MSADYDDDDVWDEPVIDVVTENKIIELYNSGLSMAKVGKEVNREVLQQFFMFFKNILFQLALMEESINYLLKKYLINI